MNPELDLSIERVIRAPRDTVWRAWTDPARFEQWWLPAPMVMRVERFEAVPGGPMVTSMSEDGDTFVPHMDAAFLLVEDGERIVFTNAIDSAWRPAEPQPVALTAEITLADHPDGTEYRALVRHGDRAARDRHEKLGFHDGWGAVADQLAALAEQEAGA
ncbi:SRPBCC family protein [Glycomyces endophyticus]|uniref:SRPBCC family protein n=1 Tax=Glycomyces endophyticus TaxID=480996 RepID=A0ABN2G106_9ACTN